MFKNKSLSHKRTKESKTGLQMRRRMTQFVWRNQLCGRWCRLPEPEQVMKRGKRRSIASWFLWRAVDLKSAGDK
jgi:hypothetical protein